MRKLIFVLLATISVSFSTLAIADSKKQLVTIVTSSNAQTQLMAMVLTMQSIKQGAEAHILLCGEAGDLALKDAPKTATDSQKPKGMSPQKLMKIIMSQTKTAVEVCAIYLPNKGVDGSALIEGVTAANPTKMGARLVSDNVRLLSF
jgi:hypothetical protein